MEDRQFEYDVLYFPKSAHDTTDKYGIIRKDADLGIKGWALVSTIEDASGMGMSIAQDIVDNLNQTKG